ncbi:MAG: class I SAM-dependent methyltransferase [Methanotrichaceae archaeon]
MKQIEIDKIYRDMHAGDIPWNIETPPKALVELIESGKVQPVKTIDLGCGAGNYAIYLASKGFDVTGVDISPTAIKMARENAMKKGVKSNFIVADVLGDLNEVKETFDFAYDWELLHHIFPEERKKYVQNVHRMLNPKGKYLSVFFQRKRSPVWRFRKICKDSNRYHLIHFFRRRTERPLRSLLQQKRIKNDRGRRQIWTSYRKLRFYGEEMKNHGGQVSVVRSSSWRVSLARRDLINQSR